MRASGLMSCGTLAGLGLLLALCGCRHGPPLPPADLSAPGWRMQQGQAVWKPRSHKPELTGDLLLATNENHSVFIQFSKDPFPITTAQTAGERWQIEFGGGQRAYSGPGKPPGLFSWFQLPGALRGETLKWPWRFTSDQESWRLENPRSGEWLEGRFFP